MKVDSVLTTIPILLSVVALVVAMVSMRRQWRSARNANAVAAILKLFEEYRTEEMRNARRTVFRMSEHPVDPGSTLGSLPDEVRGSAERVSQYFDHVGLLVGHGLVPAKPMISFFGFGCMELWKILEPHVEAERRSRAVGHYLCYFEGLARLAREVDADKLNGTIAATMQLRSMSLD